jgi:hypothetical protein
MDAIFLPLSILQAAKAADAGGTPRHRGASSSVSGADREAEQSR